MPVLLRGTVNDVIFPRFDTIHAPFEGEAESAGVAPLAAVLAAPITIVMESKKRWRTDVHLTHS